ncbi:MAG: HD domain-containing protein [Christensenellaceae bacterium]|nr:HD domain-containing protein [Christensenellaceae bacterium]
MENSIQSQVLVKYKEEFLKLLRSTGRDGMEDLIAWMENESDFFTAPASTRTHGAYEGGLLIHSLSVYRILSNFTKNIPGVDKASVIICALLHDLCKANFYIRTVRNVKIPGERRWEEVQGYGIEDTLPLGHGEKSVYMAMRYIRLTEEEAMGIRWHMGGYDDSARAYAGGQAQAAAFTKYPLAAAVAIADMYDTYIIDSRGKNE